MFNSILLQIVLGGGSTLVCAAIVGGTFEIFAILDVSVVSKMEAVLNPIAFWGAACNLTSTFGGAHVAPNIDCKMIRDATKQ